MDLDNSFFGFNSRLEQRFSYQLTIKDLLKIYQTILARSGWKINQEDEKKMVAIWRILCISQNWLLLRIKYLMLGIWTG